MSPKTPPKGDYTAELKRRLDKLEISDGNAVLLKTMLTSFVDAWAINKPAKAQSFAKYFFKDFNIDSDESIKIVELLDDYFSDYKDSLVGKFSTYPGVSSLTNNLHESINNFQTECQRKIDNYTINNALKDFENACSKLQSAANKHLTIEQKKEALKHAITQFNELNQSILNAKSIAQSVKAKLSYSRNSISENSQVLYELADNQSLPLTTESGDAPISFLNFNAQISHLENSIHEEQAQRAESPTTTNEESLSESENSDNEENIGLHQSARHSYDSDDDTILTEANDKALRESYDSDDEYSLDEDKETSSLSQKQELSQKIAATNSQIEQLERKISTVGKEIEVDKKAIKKMEERIDGYKNIIDAKRAKMNEIDLKIINIIDIPEENDALEELLAEKELLTNYIMEIRKLEEKAKQKCSQAKKSYEEKKEVKSALKEELNNQQHHLTDNQKALNNVIALENDQKKETQELAAMQNADAESHVYEKERNNQQKIKTLEEKKTSLIMDFRKDSKDDLSQYLEKRNKKYNLRDSIAAIFYPKSNQKKLRSDFVKDLDKAIEDYSHEKTDENEKKIETLINDGKKNFTSSNKNKEETLSGTLDSVQDKFSKMKEQLQSLKATLTTNQEELDNAASLSTPNSSSSP